MAWRIWRLGWLGVIASVAACSSEGYYNITPVSYTWDASGLESPREDLPKARPDLCAIAIACAASIRDEPKVACAVTIADEHDVVYDGIAGVERRGRSSSGFPKANYSLEFREADGETEVPIDVLGMGKEADWQLDGMWADRSMMRNQLAYDLFASFDEARYAAEGRYCTLVLDGAYRGIYRLVERPKRDASRIDIPKDDGAGSSFVVTQDQKGTLDFPLGLEAHWALIYPRHKDATDDQLEGVQSWFDELAKVLKRRSDDGALFEHLDRETLVDWVLIQEFSKNIDAYKLSVYLYKAPNSPARMLPWDMDLAFGQPIVASGAPEPTNAPKSKGWVGERTAFIRDILAVDGFAADLAMRWRELRAGPMADAAISSLLDGYLAAMDPELEPNEERWPLDKVTFAAIYPPYSFPERASYNDEVEALRVWIGERLVWIDENIDAIVE